MVPTKHRPISNSSDCEVTRQFEELARIICATSVSFVESCRLFRILQIKNGKQIFDKVG